MFIITDIEDNVLATVPTIEEALRKQASFEVSTGAPMFVCPADARDEAKASLTLDQAYRIGTIVWDGDILIPATWTRK